MRRSSCGRCIQRIATVCLPPTRGRIATHEPLSVEYRLLAQDGRTVWVRDEGVVVADEDGRPLYLQGYLLDITREREAQIQLRQMALYDPLTGLANRAFFHEQLQQAVARRQGRPSRLRCSSLTSTTSRT